MFSTLPLCSFTHTKKRKKPDALFSSHYAHVHIAKANRPNDQKKKRKKEKNKDAGALPQFRPHSKSIEVIIIKKKASVLLLVFSMGCVWPHDMKKKKGTH